MVIGGIGDENIAQAARHTEMNALFFYDDIGRDIRKE